MYITSMFVVLECLLVVMWFFFSFVKWALKFVSWIVLCFMLRHPPPPPPLPPPHSLHAQSPGYFYCPPRTLIGAVLNRFKYWCWSGFVNIYIYIYKYMSFFLELYLKGGVLWWSPVSSRTKNGARWEKNVWQLHNIAAIRCCHLFAREPRILVFCDGGKTQTGLFLSPAVLMVAVVVVVVERRATISDLFVCPIFVRFGPLQGCCGWSPAAPGVSSRSSLNPQTPPVCTGSSWQPLFTSHWMARRRKLSCPRRWRRPPHPSPTSPYRVWSACFHGAFGLHVASICAFFFHFFVVAVAAPP